MRIGRAGGAALVCLALLAAGGCGSKASDVRFLADSDVPAETRTAAEAVVGRYADLLEGAVRSGVREADLAGVGWERISPAVREYVEYYACEYGGWYGYRGTDLIFATRLIGFESATPESARFRATMILEPEKPTGDWTPGGEHLLELRRIQGRWRIVTDYDESSVAPHEHVDEPVEAQPSEPLPGLESGNEIDEPTTSTAGLPDSGCNEDGGFRHRLL